MEDSKKYAFDYCKFHLFSVEIAFIDFRNYQKYFEQFLSKEKQILQLSYREQISKIDADDSESYSQILENYSNKYSEIANLFPHNFRASFLIQIVAFIEHELKDICENYEFEKKTKYSIHDLKGNSDIEKAKEYLTKSCNVDFNNLNPEWQFILMAKKIRNKLIHHQGFVKKVESDWIVFNRFNKDNEYFDFSPKGETVEMSKLIIKTRFLTDKLLNMTESFFKKLLENELKYI